MTVTSSSIPLVSCYTVSDSGSFTTAIFTALKTDAEAILASDDPGLSSTLYDRALALLICHLFTVRDPSFGFSSFKSGDFSATLKQGESIYLLEYRDIISRFAFSDLSTEEADITRADADVGDMALDEVAIPSLFEDD